MLRPCRFWNMNADNASTSQKLNYDRHPGDARRTLLASSGWIIDGVRVTLDRSRLPSPACYRFDHRSSDSSEHSQNAILHFNPKILLLQEIHSLLTLNALFKEGHHTYSILFINARSLMWYVLSPFYRKHSFSILVWMAAFQSERPFRHVIQ